MIVNGLQFFFGELSHAVTIYPLELVYIFMLVPGTMQRNSLPCICDLWMWVLSPLVEVKLHPQFLILSNIYPCLFVNPT